MRLFDDIKTGLEQAIEYEKGKLNARTTILTVAPVERFRPDEIRLIRNRTGLTQIMFARYMGVSVKTVEAWEAGRNHPEGAACRLLSMTRSDPAFPQKSGIVTVAARR
ncbi:MAG: helix-turn-helix domain-containing protein [Clostridia bacterium]|nr:helix-turn-helix domain-containing protein [Clostridia bacterium]